MNSSIGVLRHNMFEVSKKKVYKSMLRELLYEQKCLDKDRTVNSTLNSTVTFKVPFLPDLLTLI